tara:strand:- start:446 stop:709 length:264 start_codon:yes stop_codon:yes gene_type:complete
MSLDGVKVAKALSAKLLKDLSDKAVDAANEESAVLGVVTSEVFKMLTSESMIELFGDAIRDSIKAMSSDDYEALVSAERVTWEDNRG